VAPKLVNGIAGNLRISSLPEQFDFNIIGYPSYPVDTLNCLLGCILLPKLGTNPESVTTPSFTTTAMSLAELIFGSTGRKKLKKLIFELKQHIVAEAIITTRLRFSCHS
jgi:hypothetical protein